jgi:hypothetical protein
MHARTHARTHAARTHAARNTRKSPVIHTDAASNCLPDDKQSNKSDHRDIALLGDFLVDTWTLSLFWEFFFKSMKKDSSRFYTKFWMKNTMLHRSHRYKDRSAYDTQQRAEDTVVLKIWREIDYVMRSLHQ